MLTGTDPTYHHQISIANGARVKLKDVHINHNDVQNETFAGLTCEGNAVLILEGTNTITGYKSNYPGIYVSEGYTLTIKGSSSDKLTVRSHGSAAGIGAGFAGFNDNCGNIVIEGGDITAYGYTDYNSSSCGAGIGGRTYSCGDIIIKGGFVKAIKKKSPNTSETAPYSIGIGSDNESKNDNLVCACGPITFDTQVFTATGFHYGTNPNSWTYSPEPANGTYGGLTLTISTTTDTNDTWTLTPAP